MNQDGRDLHRQQRTVSPHLIEKLRCPVSGGALILAEDRASLRSEDGIHSYPIIDGIPVLDPADAEMMTPSPAEMDISVLIMALNEAGNIESVIVDSSAAISALGYSYEIVVVDGGSSDSTAALAEAAGARVIFQSRKGYAEGLIEGLKSLRGRYVITLDGDCSHDPALIKELLAAAVPGAIVIGSRWMPGGSFAGPIHRGVLSRVLNIVFTRILRFPVSDISSGYRLYARETLFPEKYSSKDFSILEEILVRAKCEGYALSEIPLRYRQRRNGTSHAQLFAFAFSYLATLKRMWMLRHDANAADYDSRAYDSLNLIQRWWQRARFKNIRSLMGRYWKEGEVLDVGCGSSRIIQNLPHAVAFDASKKKLRFLARTNSNRVCGTALMLPFKDGSFDCVVHSQLIEHLPKDDRIFTELHRVLRPGGTLVIGTVDFGLWIWPAIERIYGWLMPHAYADEHISHYSLQSLKETLVSFGFDPIEVKDIVKGEITVRAVRV